MGQYSRLQFGIVAVGLEFLQVVAQGLYTVNLRVSVSSGLLFLSHQVVEIPRPLKLVEHPIQIVLPAQQIIFESKP